VSTTTTKPATRNKNIAVSTTTTKPATRNKTFYFLLLAWLLL
jgi:hypothetical protein